MFAHLILRSLTHDFVSSNTALNNLAQNADQYFSGTNSFDPATNIKVYVHSIVGTNFAYISRVYN